VSSSCYTALSYHAFMDPPLRNLNTPPPFMPHKQPSEQALGSNGMAALTPSVLSPPAASTSQWRKRLDASEIDEQATQDFSPDDILGQFSFAPTTQTTVVTTTTTTTTSFPPLKIKAPSNLHELDPKLYPLASAPTPQSMKRFCFDVGGKPTVFREADNTLDTYREVPLLLTLER